METGNYKHRMEAEVHAAAFENMAINLGLMPRKVKEGGSMTINEQINLVVEAREKADELAAYKKESLAKWELDNNELLAQIALCTSVKTEAETKLREMAIETYLKTLDKAVAPGIGIRVMTKLNYDAKEAMEWAVKHELALKLDTTKFEKIAKTENLPFVTITEEPSATIAAVLERVATTRAR